MTRPSVETASYNSVAKFLHWLIAASIIGMLALGWIMTSGPDVPGKFALFQWHKSIGLSILMLSLLRLLWRLGHRAPPLPVAMPRWEKRAAQATHFLFYVLIIGMPLTGWAIVSSSTMGLPTMYFGWFPWPNLPVLPTLENKKQVGHLFGEAHGLLAYLMAGLIVLHAGAAWKHHLFNRDNVLLHMAPKLFHPFLDWLRGM